MHDLYSKIFAELTNTGAAAYHANQRLIWASAALRGQEPRAVQDVRQARDASARPASLPSWQRS
jgi:hypothetical protein